METKSLKWLTNKARRRRRIAENIKKQMQSKEIVKFKKKYRNKYRDKLKSLQQQIKIYEMEQNLVAGKQLNGSRKCTKAAKEHLCVRKKYQNQ